MKNYHTMSRQLGGVTGSVVVRRRQFKLENRVTVANDTGCEATFWGMTNDEWLNAPCVSARNLIHQDLHRH